MKNGGDCQSAEISFQNRKMISAQEAAKLVGTRPKAITQRGQLKNGRHDKLPLMPIPSNSPIVHNLLTIAPT
jgi:hypothetical protein